MSSFHCNEEDKKSLTEMESKSIAQEISEEDARIATVIAQAEAEQCQEFCPSSVTHGLVQPQNVASFHKTLREGATRQKEHSAFGLPLQMEDERQVPTEEPSSSDVSLSIRRFEVSCCSDIYTSIGGSEELSSQAESVYIYAESIKGCDTSSSSMSQDFDSLCHYRELKKTCGVMQDPRSETVEIGSSTEALFGSDSSCNSASIGGDCDSDSSCINADWEQSFDTDSDSCNLVCDFAEAQWDSGSSCSGSAASGYIIDYDFGSSSSTTEGHSNSAFDSDFKAGHCDSLVDQCEAKHSDSAINHFEGGYHDLSVSHCKPGHNYQPVANFQAGHRALPVGHFHTRDSDSPGSNFEAGHCDLPIGHFEAGHCDLPLGHFEAGHCDSPMGHFEEGNCDLPFGHFEAGNCDSPLGHFEAGNCDSPLGHFEAGHCDSSDSHFDEASCDLYNGFPESSDADCYSGKDYNYFFNFKYYSELTWRNLQGVVSHSDRCYIAPFFHEMMKETEHDRNQEVKINKGFLFHPQRFLQAKSSKYREGQEYSVLRHIQNGSYGDVFSVRDKQTGFTCAAKRIPLSSFSWEEVATWSMLDSPRVLQLYGAVQEGLNVVLFMDLKTGSLAQFLKAKGHFPEDLALYYHCQVLQALEHLHSRNVIHLDVKGQWCPTLSENGQCGCRWNEVWLLLDWKENLHPHWPFVDKAGPGPVDNVLLSKDKRECFLCDFGLSEMLDRTGYSTKTFRGNGLRGTESHMSPEVARGDPRSDKADVWSSCCMLLHMLSGHQPWTRYYTHPFCLKIVSEPAPLWEIPAGCDRLTCDVIRGGLVKEPSKRFSARELLEKSSRALRAVGSLFDPVQSAMQTLPRPQISPSMPSPNLLTKPLMVPPPVSITTTPSQELSTPRIQWVSRWRERAAEEDGMDSEDSDDGMDKTERWMDNFWGLRNEQKFSEDENTTDEETKRLPEEPWRERAAVEKRNEKEGESDEEEIESDLGSLRELGSEDEWEPFHRLQILYGSKQRHGGDKRAETEEECLPSTRTSLSHVNSCERNSRLTLACHRSVCTSDTEITDKGSDCPDDLSSGVFSSYSSHTDERSFNVDWSVSTNQPPSCSFDGLGVDIWVEDVSGDTFRIRERLRVNLGHIAVGISAQISVRAFSLATLDRKLVSADTEVLESRTWLLCVPAPDNSSSWTWRVRDGKMETQEADGRLSDTCSTIAA